MKFSKALKAMKNGYLVKRPAWSTSITLRKSRHTDSFDFVDNFNEVQYPVFTADDFVADDFCLVETVDITRLTFIRNFEFSVYEIRMETQLQHLVQTVMVSFDSVRSMSGSTDLAKTIRNKVGCVNSCYMKLDYSFLENECERFWRTL